MAHVRDAAHNIGDLSVFREELAADDPWSAVPAADLLTGLRGKDVVIAFVESYGRVAVEGPSFAQDIRELLDAGTESLGKAGFSSRSAYLTSPTFAGISWLAHATLHSGLWIDTQQRHDQLLESDRFTLSAAFERAGWRTVVDVPSNRDPWPEGRAFYRFDEDYDRSDVGYEGPKFSFAAVPDQYTLAAFERLELGPGHAPGDGGDRPGVLARTVDAAAPHARLGRHRRRLGVRRHAGRGTGAHGRARGHRADQGPYAASIEYSLTALISFVTTLHAQDEDLVLVLLGDHQPAVGRHRAGRLARRPDLDHRRRPGRAGADVVVGLGRRAAARPGCAGVADGRIPRPVARRVRALAVPGPLRPQRAALTGVSVARNVPERTT